MASQADMMTSDDSSEPLLDTEVQERSDKGRRKSWVRSFGSIFRRKSAKSSENAVEEVPTSMKLSSEQEPEPPLEQPDPRETQDREEVCRMESIGTPRKKRPYINVSNETWSFSRDASVGRNYHPDLSEPRSASKLLEDEMGEQTISGPISGSSFTRAASNTPHFRNSHLGRKPSNAHTLFFLHESSPGNEEVANHFEGKATGHPSNTGCIPFIKTFSEKGPEKVPGGQLTYGKAGGPDEDKVSFEISLDASLMNQVLYSMQEGNTHADLSNKGRRDESTIDLKGKCSTNVGADDSSQAFIVEIERCGPPEGEGGNMIRNTHPGGNDIEESSDDSSFPGPTRSFSAAQMAENQVQEKKVRKSRKSDIPEDGRLTKTYTKPNSAKRSNTSSDTSSDSPTGSYSSCSNYVMKEGFDKGRGLIKGGPKSTDGSRSVGRQSKRTSDSSSLDNVGPEEDSESEDEHDRGVTTVPKKVGLAQSKRRAKKCRKDNHESRTDRSIEKETAQTQTQFQVCSFDETLDRDITGRKIRKRCLSSNPSMENRWRRRIKRLRDKAGLEIEGRQKGRVKPSTKKGRSACCSCMGSSNTKSTSSAGSGSLSATSGRDSGVDACRVGDDGRHPWKDSHNNDDNLGAYKNPSDEGCSWKSFSAVMGDQNVWTTSDGCDQSCNTRSGKIMSYMKSGLRAAKRAGWNFDKATSECQLLEVNEEKMAAEIRKYQSSYRNIDPSDESTTHSFSESKASIEDTFLSNVNVFELPDYLSAEDRGVEDGKNCVYGDPGNPPAGTQVHILVDNRGYKSRMDWEYTGGTPEQIPNLGGCDSRELSSEPVQGWTASPQVTCDEEYYIQDRDGEKIEEEFQSDPGRKNKWLQRIGKLSVARESDAGDAHDRNTFIQHETEAFLPQSPLDCKLRTDCTCGWNEVQPAIPKCSVSHSRQDYKKILTSDQHIQTRSESYMEEELQKHQGKEPGTPKWNCFFPQGEAACLEDEWSERHSARKKDSKNLETQDWLGSSTDQHMGNRESVAEALEASQSLLQGNVPMKQQCDFGGCCHVQSRNFTENSLRSIARDVELRENAIAAKKGTHVQSSKHMGENSGHTSALENEYPKDTETSCGRGLLSHFSQRLCNKPVNDGPSLPNVPTAVPCAELRMKAEYIAGAIKGGNRERYQDYALEESCNHEYIDAEDEDELTCSGEFKRRKRDISSSATYEGDLNSLQNVSKVLHELPLNDIDDLKQREVSWKQYQNRYEAMLRKIEQMSAQAHSSLVKTSQLTAGSNQLNETFQNSLTDSNVPAKSCTQSTTQFQNLASCSCKRSQQEGKHSPGNINPRGRSLSARTGRKYVFAKNTVKRIFKTNESEDSSSDDDIDDQASRKFRDELFKRTPGKNFRYLNSSSQVLTVSCGDCARTETRKKVGEVQKHLQALSDTDAFRFSSVNEELLRVEQEMKAIARAFASCAHPQQSDYLGLQYLNDPRQCRKPRKYTESESECLGGGSELVDWSSPDAQPRSSDLMYENPLWSKGILSKSKSCGDPLSVQMAARLIEAEVPIDYENGYKVQYIPVDKRGRIGMRDKPPEWYERSRLYNLSSIQHERSEPLKNPKPSACSSSCCSSSSSCKEQDDETSKFPGDLEKQKQRALTYNKNYESSSSNSGSEFLHRRHQRRVSKEARHIRKKTFESEDSDTTDSTLLSDDPNSNLDLFVGEAEEQLARLKLAKVQLGNLSQECLAEVRKFYKEPLSKKSERTGSGPSKIQSWTAESFYGESDYTLGRPEKREIRKRCKSIPKAVPLKKLTAREIKEFHLLERRVQRELGAAGRNTKPAKKCLKQEEGVFECLKDVDDNVPCGQVGSHDDYHKIGHHTPSRVDLKAFPGKELRDGKSYQGEQPTGPISSVVRLFFGTQSEEPRADEERTANNLQDVYPIIRKKVEHLEAEIVNFTKGNRKIKTLLKEQEDNAAQLKQEKAAWEQQKASDMEAFQKFKEAQVREAQQDLNMLQKERSKLEHQARATSSKTAKKDDRRALDELRATLAQEQNAHFKKEQQWRLTSNRLRNANKDLLEQIQELRKEIGRHEAQILLQLDARESGSDTSAQSSQTKARGMKQRDTIKSRFTQGLPTGSQLGTSTVIGDDSMISRDARNIKQVKSHIASTCDEATMMLAQKMKDLEEDVESWTYFHPD